MPLVHRVTRDMFEFADVTDYMVNPVNLMGAPGIGLALEFRTRVPSFFEPYRKACRSGELRIGTVQVIEDTGENWGIINFPTKRHYANLSSKEDIVRGLEALRDLLKQDRYKYCSIGMPMLGCGYGKQDYETVYPLMVDHLSDLDATVFLSMAPDKTEMKPKYLTIVGPLDFGRNEEERQVIDRTIDTVMEKWDTSLSSYTGIVSGGYPGVDAYIAGEDFRKKVEDTYVFKKTGQMGLVVKPNRIRKGVGSNLYLGNLLCEIGDNIILFKPKGHNNNRMSAMQAWLESDADKREKDGREKRRVAVFGEKSTEPVIDNIPIPIPY